MGELEDFEKRFSNAFFSVGWVDVEVKPAKKEVLKKDLETLQSELNAIEENIKSIEEKQLRLANLATFYQ